MKPALIALLLLSGAALVPGAAHAALPPWSLDEVVTIDADQQHALRTWHIVYDAHVYSDQWTLAIPPGVTLIGAHDKVGSLTNSSSAGTVHVTTRSGDFFVDLREPLTTSGAFLSADAGPSAASDSPTSVRYELPAGWTLAGWTASPGAGAPKNATWRATGPFFVEGLLLPSGASDPGPDARGAHGVARDAMATVSKDQARVDVTIVYDTEQYSPSWLVPVPDGATLTAVTAPLGKPTFSVKSGTATIETPYPFAHHLGARPFTLQFSAPLWRFGGGFLRANLSVPAGANDSTTLHTTLDGVDFVGATLNGVSADDGGSYTSGGPLALALVVLPPSTTRAVQGPFVVEAPDAATTQQAIATAKAAATILASAAPFADTTNTKPMFVIYTNEPVFQWEEGVYSGNQAISIRATDLSGDASNITPLRTLVHEATHGLADQTRKGAPSDSSFLNEGLARLSEIHIELAHPDAVVKCVNEGTSQRCTLDSSRIDAEQLQSFYKRGGTFDLGWSAAKASDAERAFDYDYSGFVLASYERNAPGGALGRAFQALTTNLNPTSDDIVAALLHEAPGMTRDQLLYPAKEKAGLSSDAFATALGDLVAPPFPKGPGGAFAGVPGVGAPAMMLGIAALALALRARRDDH